MKLFYTPGACSMVPHIVLEEIGLPYESAVIDFAADDQLKPEYLAINPAGRVPVLTTDRGVVTEIPAILGYLARAYPQAGLAPADDPFAFADMQAFHMFIATTIHVLFRQISRPEVYADGPETKAALAAKVPEMSDRYFGLIEARFADGRPWVHGDRYTMSDPYLFVFASYLKRGDRGDPKKIPRIWAHRDRVYRQRPAVARVLAQEGIPDFY
jgi:glutathione S-transferase